MSYPVGLYDETRETVKKSAAIVTPMLVDMFAPESMIDVGCGEGWWAAEFEDHGCPARGLDAEHVTSPAIKDFHAVDLERRITDGEKWHFDLALCLEVAEHLSPQRAQSFAFDLTRLAPVVVFSAAIPGQGGAGHVNEQWPSYWCSMFAESGYHGTGAFRAHIWEDRQIAPWYRQNLLVFGPQTKLPMDDCPALVHPEIWSWYR